MERLFAIAKIVQATGLNGEVRLRSLSRYFSDYMGRHPLYLGFSEDLAREIRLEEQANSGKRERYQFRGINTREEAEALIGQIVFVNVPEDDFINLSSDNLIDFDVITNTGEHVGVLVDILMLPANDVYVIESGNREILIPVIPEIINGVDEEDGCIVITPMDGLLD